jgi:hypothetical protein
MAEKCGKTGKLTIGLWFDEKAGDIHLSIPDHGLSTVGGDATSKRGHPHLFNKLAKVLRHQGKPRWSRSGISGEERISALSP